MATKSGLPEAVMNVREQIAVTLGPGRCLAWRQTADDRLGVLAYDVCGLGRGHFGKHQAGWTGTGEFWAQETQDPEGWFG